jgi:hypothetical protein
MANYYSLIAQAVAGLESNTRDSRQAVYDRARTAQTTQLKKFDPALSKTEISREFQALEEAIRRVEAEAATADAEEVSSDAQVVLDYAAFMTETTTREDCFYDVEALPHPKEVIVAAIEREIVRSPLEAHVDWLRTGAVSLWNFLEGVGPDPLPMKGGPIQLDFSQPLEVVRPADRGEFGRIITSPEHEGDSERSANLMDVAIREYKQIEERIAAAIRRREALRRQ